jgi:hypothetical protein
VTRSDALVIAAFAGAAALLLAATVAWMLPMMLWDHLDLLPMVEGVDQDRLAGSGFWDSHGGHLHTAAYALLLVTTFAADGQPWLDGVVSWSLLVLTAAVVLAVAMRTVPATPERPFWLLAIVLLALFPGHLANLQWGWQVAVFLCLAGSVLAIVQLALPRPGWRSDLFALAGASLALASFATALALVPTALVLILTRRTLAWPARVARTLPWLVLAGLALLPHLDGAGGGPGDGRQPLQLAAYALNFLGGGVARFATDLAPWLAAGSLAVAMAVLRRQPLAAPLRPWFGLLLFGLFASVVVALGRAAPFGTDHAFVTRYVSFSSLYWLGWTGLMATSAPAASAARGLRRVQVWATLFVALALANAAHLTRKAARLSDQGHAIAAEIRATWPAVREDLLRDIYFDQPDRARQRLDILHRYRWPPFAAEQPDG